MTLLMKQIRRVVSRFYSCKNMYSMNFCLAKKTASTSHNLLRILHIYRLSTCQTLVTCAQGLHSWLYVIPSISNECCMLWWHVSLRPQLDSIADCNTERTFWLSRSEMTKSSFLEPAPSALKQLKQALTWCSFKILRFKTLSGRDHHWQVCEEKCNREHSN